MTDDLRELLGEYALGTLAQEDAEAVAKRVEQDPLLAQEADELAEVWTAMAMSLPPAPPPPRIKQRLLASVAEERFLPFVDDLARFCDLAVDTMRKVLQRITDADAWEAGPLAGVSLIHFDHGPACVGADTGLVKMVPGLAFPTHRHHGPEVNYVLQGRLIDDDGQVYGPGDALQKQEGQPHGFRIGDEQDLIMVVIHNGFDIVEAG